MKANNSIFYFLKISLLIGSFFIYPLIIFSQVAKPVKLNNSPDSSYISQLPDSSDTLKIKDTDIRVYIPDTVFLLTGDKITGKIISFEQGRLKIDAQATGVVTIKWNKISSVNGGNRIFKVEDIHGVIYKGRIELSPDTGEIHVLSNYVFGVRIENIARIYPLEAEWYRGIKGTLGAGLNYTKSSDVLTTNSEYNLYYVISKWRFINDFSFVSTSTSNEDASIRLAINFQALYALPNRWVLSEINSFSRNDELGVKSRFSFGAGGGNNLVQTDWQRLLMLTGIVVNLEKDIESNSTISNLEWPLTIQHTIYKFAYPNLSSTTSITSFVGITEKDRYRLDASLDLTWEFVKNFKLQLSFYYNYDNKTIEGKNSKKDYGTILSLLLDLK